MSARPRLIIVGGGILGTMHALEGVDQGYDVVQLERDDAPRGASVRNFGLIWVSGRVAGAELELALEARERWASIGAEVPGTGFRPLRSLTLARSAEEATALKAAATDSSASRRRTSWLDVDDVRKINPAIGGEIAGALVCEIDAAVEPRLVLGALRAHLAKSAAYEFLPGIDVRDLVDHAVIDQRGKRYEGDLVICCTGASRGGPFGDIFDAAPIRRVRLQMLETEPFDQNVTTAVADGDSMRYYPAFESVRAGLAPQADVGARWRAQLLLVQRLAGHLTIGDTHAYDEPFPFDIADEPTHHLIDVAGALLGQALPPIERRWAGVYCEVTTPDAIYYRAQVEAGVFIVTGPGGRGMTLSPAIAAASFR